MALTPTRLRECQHCGQLQVLPPMPPASRAVCLRCDAVLRHTHHDPLGIPLALNLSALLMLIIATASTLMSVSRLGQYHIADLFSGPISLGDNGMWELSLVVMFTTLAAPLGKLLATTLVLLGIRLGWRQRDLRVAFAWVQWLRPWSMIEVYLLAVCVAYVRLGSLVTIGIGPAVYALAAVMLVMVAADYSLDPEAVWEAIGRGRPGREVFERRRVAARAHRIGCSTCHYVARAIPGDPCPRCGFRLRPRKTDSIARTWALGIAALIFYLPANFYPVLTITNFGQSYPSTILGGVRDLLDAGVWPVAAVVFFASIVVPGLKLSGLAILLTMTQLRRRGWLHDRTRLYRLIDHIGRWSMIDIFMGSLLVALLQFGMIVSVIPGPGALAFALVVVLTILAAQTFDPRLMWDASGARAEPLHE